MPTYRAYFFTEADYAKTMIEADTPELALQRARQIESEETETLDFQSYDGSGGVEHIEICDTTTHATVIEWQHDGLRLRRAAPKLLATLEWCDMTLADLDASKRKGYIAEAKRLTRAAIAEAKGGAQ